MSDQLFGGSIVRINHEYIDIECTHHHGERMLKEWTATARINRVGDYIVGDIVEVIIRRMEEDE